MGHILGIFPGWSFFSYILVAHVEEISVTLKVLSVHDSRVPSLLGGGVTQ